MKLILLFLLLAGCASTSYDRPYVNDGRFNIEDEQDKGCINNFGGRYGYCDSVYRGPLK
jgi:hypothetical protein